MAQFDAKSVHRNDWGVIGGGALVLIASFMTWFSIDLGGASAGANGWDSGGLATLGILCSIIAAGLVAARVFGVDLPQLGFGWRTIVLALSAVAAVFILLKLLMGESAGIVDLDRDIGLFLATIGAIAQAVFAYFAFAESGERADIDRMRAERAANRPAAGAAAGNAGATTDFAAPPPAPAGWTAPTDPVDGSHDHSHDGPDHPHPHS